MYKCDAYFIIELVRMKYIYSFLAYATSLLPFSERAQTGNYEPLSGGRIRGVSGSSAEQNSAHGLWITSAGLAMA